MTDTGSETVIPPDVIETLDRIAAARDLLRLERRIARQEDALRVLRLHRQRLLALIGGGGA